MIQKFKDNIRKLIRKVPILRINHDAIIAKQYMISYGYPINPVPRYGYGMPYHAGLFEIINSKKAEITQTLKQFLSYKDPLSRINQMEPDDATDPYWSNKWFSSLDAIAFVLHPLKSSRY